MKWKPSQSPLSSVQLRHTPERFQHIMGLSVSDFDALLQRLGDTTNEPQRSSVEKLAEEVSIALLFMRQSMSKEVLSVCFGREEVEVEDILQRLQPRLEATQAPHHKSSSAIRSRKHLLDSENNKIEAERLLHELQVHQVELQAQNEELKTSRSETEEQLLRYTKLYEFAPMGYFTVLRDGAIIQKANLAAERLMGLPRREIINQPFERFIEEESRVVVYDLLKKAFARATDDEPEGCEVKMLTDENKPFWAHIRTIVSADRQFCRIVVLDIRVIKENEEALRKSEAVFRSALQSLSEGVVVHDAASVIQLCNPQAEQILGLTVEQMKGRTSFDPRWRSVHEDGSPFHGENHPVPITLKTGMSQHNVIMGVHKPDGSLNWISINAEPIIFEGETEIRGAIATFTDITERKRAQEELRVKEQRFRSFVELQGTYFLCTDLAGNYTYASPAHIRTFGMGKTSLIGLNGLQHIIPEDHAKMERTVEQCLQNPGTPVSVVLRKPSSSGEILLTEWECITVTDAKGVVAEIQCIGHDITELKRMEEHYLRSNQLLEASQSIAKVGGWELDIGSSHLYWTAETYRIHDTSPEEFNPTVDAGVGYFLPDSKRQISAALELAMTEGKGYDLTLETYTTKGRHIHVRTTCKVTSIDGKPITLTGIFQDITEQKKSEQVLKDSEQRLGLALDGGNLGLWDWDALTNTLIVNERWLSMLGLNPSTTIPTLDFWHSLVHPEDMPILQNLIDTVISNPNGKRVEAEVRAKHANGEYIWILDKGVIVSRDNNGNPLRIAGTHMDITERKQAEAALENALKRLELATHAANIGIWEYGLNDSSLIWDNQMYALYGITQTTFSGTYEAWQTGLHPEDRERSEHELEVAIAGGKDFDTEFRVVWPDQSIHHIRAFATVIFDAFGKAIKMIGANYDITERKEIINELVRAKEKAEESERRLVIAQGVTKVGSWETDLQTLEVVWSEETYKIFGTDHLSFQASHPAFLEFVHPEDKEKVDKAFLESFTKTGINVVEHRILPVGNSVKYVEERWQIHSDLNGKPTRAVGTCQDITERKRAEEKLRKTEENQQRILETMGVGVTVTRNGQVLFANESWCKLIGYTAEEIRSFDFYDIVHPVSRQLIRERGLARMRGKEVPDRYETQFCHKNGTILWIDISAFLIEYEGMIAVISTMVDITDRKRAENLLAASEERYRSFVELQGTYFLRTDLEGKYTYASPAHIQTFGMGQTSLIGRSGLEHIIPEDHEKTFRVIEQCLLKPGTAVSVILRKPSTSGKILWTEWEFITIQDANGAVIEIQCVGHDITDRKIAEQELLNLNQTLEQRVEQRTRELVLLNNEKNEFLGIAAHDLKNPLSGILTSAEILERYYGGEAQTKRYISMIVSASEQMLDIIENLLDVNKIESGLLKVNIIPISLDVVSAVVDDYQQRATNKGIIFCFFPSVDEPAPVVLADEKALWQVLDNLVSNAVKYSPHWKTVNVRVLSRTDEEGNCFGRVEIQDEGPGISETDMHKLFDKFTRLSAQPTGGENSTGLGLSIVKKLVELQQGQVWCESELGKGATFIVEFPCA